jgi:hypothetical protein
VCNQRCFQAKSLPSSCRCECARRNHGRAWSVLPSAASTRPGHSDLGNGITLPPSASYGADATGENHVGITDHDEGSLIDAATASIADWLTSVDHSPPDLICDMVAEILGDKVGAKLNQHCGPDRRTRLELAFGGHFLCSLLAALACLADEVQDRVPKAAEATIESKRRQGRPLADDFAVKVAVQAAWDEAAHVAQQLLIVSQLSHVILFARVLALVTCPAPESHEDVRRCCFNRLIQSALTDSVKRLLAAAIPPSWTLDP